jgi:uncharacterized membrane protein YgaE (UPF0421/DUF939 family)
VPTRIDTRAARIAALRRVRSSWGPVALASVAAALAWLIAHRLLGHPQPFFAPIAAAIALSTSRIQRSRRIAQMVTGVLLGIGIGELLVSTLGTSTAALGVIVFVTFSAALLAGAGFFSEGMMFANQAAASAILVVTLRRHGTGAERAVDVLVGGAVALILGVALFPAQPLTLLREAERGTLGVLARTLQEFAETLAAGEPPPDGWMLGLTHEIHRQLGALARARSTARANVRIAPRRWRLRATIEHEDARTARLDLLANAVLGLVRAGVAELEQQRPPAEPVRARIGAMADALTRLAQTPQPWPSLLRAEIDALIQGTIEREDSPRAEPSAVLASILRATARDLSEVIGTA